MSLLLSIVQMVLIGTGVLFFLVGSIGLLRFPDTYTRIHALTKADNLGLGMLIVGLLPFANSVQQALKILLCWVLILAASSVSAYLVANKLQNEEPDA